ELQITPRATAISPPVVATGGMVQTVTVTYTDDVGIDVSSLGTGDITVTGPGGVSVIPTFETVNDFTNGTPRLATYQFTPPGGAWDGSDNGAYTINMNANQVFDTDPVMHSVLAGSIGGFSVLVPAQFVVTTNADSGAGSLRDAIAQANATAPSNDTITL